MKTLKPIFIVAATLLALTFILPPLLVLPSTKEKSGSGPEADVELESMENYTEDSITEVAVFRTKTETVETFPLEEYVIGVVASEMPASFELEALKAQALAARTYIVNFLLNGNADLPQDADITDTIQHQVFKNKEDLQKQWGKDFEEKYNKIAEAVNQTKGEILTYNGRPITASFFSTSNGYTENSEDYWENSIPYLKSVESPWDEKSPEFEKEKTLTLKEFEEKLGIKVTDKNDIGTITKRTEGNKVAEVKIGGKTFTGREIREKLGLRSTHFSWMRSGNTITITTKGFGHGVGMSQYGANGMAQEGKNYRDIVTHYYQNIDISNVDSFLDKQYVAK